MLKPLIRITLIVIMIASVLTLNVRLAKAATTIYIKADGTVDPPDSPIQRNGNLYIFTANIYDSIVVQRDNIVIDGAAHILQGTVEIGIDVSSRTNVTIGNLSIKEFDYGVYLSGSTRINISKSNIINNYEGIWLSSSDFNTISSNNITTNTFDGIYLYYSSNNTVSGNNVTKNIFDGIYLSSSSNNSISGNNLTENGEGIASYYSTNNRIVHNNFIGNSEQVYTRDSADIWNNGYEGNYWGDYSGDDLYRGLYQNETGSDGIGDTPYTIDANNTDNYPLMKPYPWDPHDIGITYIGKVWETHLIVLLKTVVGLGLELQINVFVMNYGAYSEVFSVTVYANSTAIETITDVTLASRNSIILNLTWNTAGFAKSNYTISAYAEPVQGETETTGNTFTDSWVMVAMVGDVTGPDGWPDGKVDMIHDIRTVAKLFGVVYSNPRYIANCDINDDGIIDMIHDIRTVAKHFGETDS